MQKDKFNIWHVNEYLLVTWLMEATIGFDDGEIAFVICISFLVIVSSW